MHRTTLQLTPLEPRDNPVSGFSAAGAAAGGLPLVAVFRPDGSTLARFSAFEDTFRGGVRAAAAELDGDPNTQEVVVGAGPGGGPAVKVFSVDIRTGAVIPRSAFFAFEPSFTGGVRVTAGNVAARLDGLDQIVIGAGEGGGPRVRTVDGNGTSVNSALGDFFAFEPSFRGGVQVTAGELNGIPSDGAELVVAAGNGGGPRVRVLRSDGAVLADYFAFDQAFRGGANVTVVGTFGLPGRIVPDAFALDPSQRNAALNSAAQVPTPTVVTVTTTPATSTNIGGSVTNIGGGVTGIGGATTAGALGGVATQSGITATTSATGIGGQATGAGGVTSATGATNISTQALGAGGFTGQTVGASGFGTQTTTVGGVTSAATAGGLTLTGLTDNGLTTSIVTLPSVFAFGPFGNPGPALPTPILTNPPFIPGGRYAIPV